MKKILFYIVFITLSTSLFSSEGVLVDKKSGLTWQDNGIYAIELDWYEAGDYCQELHLGDYDDWYLPTIGELRKFYKIKSHLKHRVSGYTWSATPRSKTSRRAWYVNLSDGVSKHYYKASSFHVRCVRKSDK